MDLLLVLALALLAWLSVKGSNAGGGAIADYENNDPTLEQVSRAVAQVESGNRQTDANGNIIKSSAGALGIMQLMPNTAAGLGVDPYDAAQNYAGGQSYLNSLYAKYGDWPDALAAYNWGPGNVDRALGSGASYPTSVQGYAQKVLSLLGLE